MNKKLLLIEMALSLGVSSQGQASLISDAPSMAEPANKLEAEGAPKVMVEVIENPGNLSPTKELEGLEHDLKAGLPEGQTEAKGSTAPTESVLIKDVTGPEEPAALKEPSIAGPEAVKESAATMSFSKEPLNNASAESGSSADDADWEEESSSDEDPGSLRNLKDFSLDSSSHAGHGKELEVMQKHIRDRFGRNPEVGKNLEAFLEKMRKKAMEEYKEAKKKGTLTKEDDIFLEGMKDPLAQVAFTCASLFAGHQVLSALGVKPWVIDMANTLSDKAKMALGSTLTEMSGVGAQFFQWMSEAGGSTSTMATELLSQFGNILGNTKDYMEKYILDVTSSLRDYAQPVLESTTRQVGNLVSGIGNIGSYIQSTPGYLGGITNNAVGYATSLVEGLRNAERWLNPARPPFVGAPVMVPDFSAQVPSLVPYQQAAAPAGGGSLDPRGPAPYENNLEPLEAYPVPLGPLKDGEEASPASDSTGPHASELAQEGGQGLANGGKTEGEKPEGFKEKLMDAGARIGNKTKEMIQKGAKKTGLDSFGKFLKSAFSGFYPPKDQEKAQAAPSLDLPVAKPESLADAYSAPEEMKTEAF